MKVGSHQAYVQREAAALSAVQEVQASAFTCAVNQANAWPAISFQIGKECVRAHVCTNSKRRVWDLDRLSWEQHA